MPRTMPVLSEELLTKAKHSALLAVELYNRPSAEFRVQAFIMLMHTAWNSVLLASLLKAKKKPYQRDGRRFRMRNGERMTWSLSRCATEYWGGKDTGVQANLRFFIQLRDKIEHYRDQSALPVLTFGECQSLVVNFEEFVTREFGDRHSLVDSLALSIQLSRLSDPVRPKAILNATDRATTNLRGFIDTFRSSLTDDVYADVAFSHRLFLVPKTVNHPSRDALSIEWIDVASLSADDRDTVDSILTGIVKTKQVPVANLGGLKPTEVCRRVSEALDLEVFSPS